MTIDAALLAVRDLMTDDLITVAPTDPVGRVRDLMVALGVHSIPVVETDEVVGIITTSDLVDDWPDDLKVIELMTFKPLAISAEASISEAAGQMIDAQIHHLLVEEDGLTVGLLSSLDLLKALV